MPELCGRLGFSIPTYVVRATNKEAPLYEGYADFGDEPRVSDGFLISRFFILGRWKRWRGSFVLTGQ